MPERGLHPVKALLHNAAVIDEVSHLAANGIKFGKPEVDIDMLRGYKEKVIAKLTGGLGGMAKARKVGIVRGNGHFIDPHHIEVSLTTGRAVKRAARRRSSNSRTPSSPPVPAW